MLNRKIPKISPRAYIFQRPFLRGLWEVCISKSIGLANSWKGIYRFCFVLLCIKGQFSKYKPLGGAYIWRSDFTEGFLCYEFGGLIFGGAYFRNFTVVTFSQS